MADEPGLPSEEEIAQALDRVTVADVIVNALSASVSLGYHRLSAEARDLPQARLAIEALRALDPVLREAGVDEALVRDLEQARANLQLAYAKAVSEGSQAAAAEEPRTSEAEEGRETTEQADESGASWTTAS